jgi:hypothetical protein
MEDEDDEDDEDNKEGSDDDDEVPDLAGDDSTLADTEKKDKKASKSEESEEDDGEEWEDEDAEHDDDEEINDTCDIILDDEVEKGEEITRHYGPYPNKILLSKYGFAVENNPHDTVTIQLDMVRQAAQKILKDEKLVEERTNWFLENEDAFIGAEDDDEGGCCGGGDHDHHHDHEHGHDHHGHEHAEGDDCCGPKVSKKSKAAKSEAEAETEEDDDQEMEDEEDEDEEDDFPRDIMYMMHDGSIDDRLLMLLNVLFMEKGQFAKVQGDMEAAMEYFNDIFMRREQEERGDEDEDMEDEDDDEEKPPKQELAPRDEKSKKTRKAVLEAILTLIRIRADAFGVTDKTTAEQDLASLKKVLFFSWFKDRGVCLLSNSQTNKHAAFGNYRRCTCVDVCNSFCTQDSSLYSPILILVWFDCSIIRQSCLDHFTMEGSVFRVRSRFFKMGSRDMTVS